MIISKEVIEEMKQYDELLKDINIRRKVPILTGKKKDDFIRFYHSIVPDSKDCFSCNTFWIIRLATWYVKTQTPETKRIRRNTKNKQ